MNRVSQRRLGTIVYRVMILWVALLPFVLRADSAYSRSASSPGITYELFFPAVFGKPSHIYIPAGTFQMGCDAANNDIFLCIGSELPLHEVYLNAYYIDRTEVTNAQYAACVAAGACSPPTSTTSFTRTYYYGNPTYDNYPVLYVNWYKAETYCAWAGGRIPTEAEWEKAARGGSDTRPYPWGTASPTCDRVNAKIDEVSCVGDTTEVGSYSPAGDSPYGVQDMVGNVYEFMSDWYSPNYYQVSPDSNPQGPSSGTYKVRRSGAFGSWGSVLRVAIRIPTDPTLSTNYFGFRCAYSP